MSIHIDLEALDERLSHGERWIRGWGDFESPDGKTCLHGAIRFCQPIKGDAYLIERVSTRYGFGTSDNDVASSWDEVRAKIIPDITDEMLAETFGPQWEQIVALVRRISTATPDEAIRLGAAWDAAWGAAWDAAWGAAWDAARGAARDAARDAARGAAWDAARGAAWDAARDAARGAARGAAWDAARGAAWDAARGAAWDAARDAAWGLVVRDLIGKRGFTQAQYDLLTGPWRSAIGPLADD